MLLFELLEVRLARGLAHGPWFVVVLKFVVVVMPVVFVEDTEY